MFKLKNNLSIHPNSDFINEEKTKKKKNIYHLQSKCSLRVAAVVLFQSDQFNNDDYAISFHSQLVVTTTHREIIEKKGRKS